MVFQEFKVWVGSIWQFPGCNTHHSQFQATYVMLLHVKSGSEAQLAHYKYHVSTDTTGINNLSSRYKQYNIVK